MANALDISDQVLLDLARQVANLLPLVFATVEEPDAQPAGVYLLHESFEVWDLALDRIHLASDKMLPLSEVARDTGLYHHQLFQGETPAGFVRSSAQPESGTKRSVEEVALSDLARYIDESIDTVDELAPDDLYARLLRVPAFYIHALWLTNDYGARDSARVFVLPDLVLEQSAEWPPLFSERRLLSEQEFVDALAQLPSGSGIILGSA